MFFADSFVFGLEQCNCASGGEIRFATKMLGEMSLVLVSNIEYSWPRRSTAGRNPKSDFARLFLISSSVCDRPLSAEKRVVRRY